MEESSISEGDKKYTRRTVIKTAVVSAAAAATGLGMKFGSPLVEGNNGPSKEEIQQKYNIRFLSTFESKSISDRINTIPESEENIEWDQERIALTDQLLQALPPELYTTPDKKPLNLVLFGKTNPEDGASLGSTIGATVDAINNVLFFNVAGYRKYEGRAPLERLSHELIHYTHSDPQWQEIPALQSIFEGDFKDVKDKIKEQAYDAMGDLDTFDDCLTYRIASFFSTAATSSDYPDEFIAYLGEFYIYGDAFTTALTRIFGEEKAQELQSYARDSLFYGKTYDKFPVDAYYEESSDQDGHHSTERRKLKEDEWVWSDGD